MKKLLKRRRFVKYVAGGTVLLFGAGFATHVMAGGGGGSSAGGQEYISRFYRK